MVSAISRLIASCPLLCSSSDADLEEIISEMGLRVADPLLTQVVHLCHMQLLNT